MKDIGEGTIRRIDWTELTPVVLLLRIFNIALGVRILAVAMIGLWLTVLLGFTAGADFLNPKLVEPTRQGELQISFNPLNVFYSGIMDTNVSVRQNPTLLLWLPGVLLVWTLCGGIICRIVAVRLTIDESETIDNLLLFLRKRGISLISAPLLLLLGIGCCLLPVKIANWMMAVPYLNYVVAILFPIPLVFAFFTVILALGLVVGWMLLFAAVSTDGSDGFDAISRLFSYMYQRPLHYLLYWLCCVILGCPGFLLVLCCTYLTILLSLPYPFDFLVSFWLALASSIPAAYLFTWFWTSSVAIYLLLRRSVDATPFQEVYRVSPPTIQTLPTIKPDEHGAPEIASL